MPLRTLDVAAGTATEEASTLLRVEGCVLLHGVFEPTLIGEVHATYTDRYRSYLDERAVPEDAMRVGDGRLQVPVELSGTFADPSLYANPFVLSVVRDTLGADAVLNSFGSVVALPGAAGQAIHRDHPDLFEDGPLFPPFAVTAIIPLVEMNEEHGTTRLWATSHLDRRMAVAAGGAETPTVPVGSCLLMDYRLVHAGTANRSSRPRPILYTVYSRPWFVDRANFKRHRALLVPPDVLADIPPQHRGLFEAAGA
jgi:hypothetical protein